MKIKLSPSQQQKCKTLQETLENNNVVVFWGYTGLGKTTILRVLQQELQGKIVDIQDLLAMQRPENISLEESLGSLLLDCLAKHDLVFVDDLLELQDTFASRKMLNLILNSVCAYAEDNGKKIVFSCSGKVPVSVLYRAECISLEQFQSEDYQHILAAFLGKQAKNLDFEKIYRFATRLNAYQLKSTAMACKSTRSLKTQNITEYFLNNHLVSNVVVEDVEKVALSEIKGLDEVLRTLETHVILPLEQDKVAQQYDLKHKKGVLLYGPPGTGKTSIGRILAHRLKGKFFSIDGRFVSSHQEFHIQVQKVFEAAKQNSPSVIFIDEADVFWSQHDDTGLYRYLLTELDGIEGTREGTICVMITAMDLSKIPPALVRSGRIELWLELSLPDEQTRSEILQHWIKKIAKPLQKVDIAILARHTEKFSGADLRRITEDVKNLYAYDKISGNTLLSIEEYFLKAIEVIKENHGKREEAEKSLEGDNRTPMLSLHDLLGQIPQMFK